MEERGQFTFYRSFYKSIMLQPKNRQRAMFAALCEYALDGVEPELPGACMSAFVLMQPVLDAAWRKAEGASREKTSDSGKKISQDTARIPKDSARISQDAAKKKKIEKKKENDIDSECKGTAVQPMPGDGTHPKEKTDFDVFFESYPNAVGRDGVKEAWDEVVTDGRAVLESLRKWKRSPQWCREEGRFVPRAQKWLRERWFEASPAELPPMGATGELGDAELAAARAIMEES